MVDNARESLLRGIESSISCSYPPHAPNDITHAHLSSVWTSVQFRFRACSQWLTPSSKGPPHASSVQECGKMHKVIRHHEIAETLSVVFWFLLALDILVLGGVFGLGEYLTIIYHYCML